MSFSQEQLTSKLNALDETQESIVSASKWLLSQYKEASQVAQCWRQFILKSSTNTRRKLLAIYLANDVIQQSKHKRVGEFGTAFGAIMPEVLGKVYPEFTQELQRKVKRVVDIWRERQVFSDSVFKELYPQLKQSKRPTEPRALPLDIAPEIKRLVEVFAKLTKCQSSTFAAKTRFDTSLEALDPNSVVYLENYKTVQKVGQAAKDSLDKSVSYRKQAIKELQIMLNFQEEQMKQDQSLISEIDQVLISKDPASATSDPLGETDLLPTYEASDGSDSDSDRSIGGEGEPPRKRQSLGTDSNELKRAKTETGTIDEVRTEEYETEAYEPTPAEVAANSSLAVTSSIQDLLSKLAN
ncbi:Rtt103p [Lachancea thermotolerans CBS 6340]|uniref:KLTH0G06424p n=1 Tax=Lachancea thermotolerans (strain ATCC 56472 / CBS 6340 / NRRL Y-8284) TaxID=559295 RepID=C5DM69_LACTC|nr:KLTH0G06424p [Lachancea thermotolerans CBS 6340]CAR24880.1 KLTH0G06424p [Lachancea thermotolerans CBS 6340]